MGAIQQILASYGGFAGPADSLTGAGIQFAVSSRRLLSSYTGNATVMRGNGTGSPTANIGYTASGDLDQAAIAALIATGGGSAAFWTSWLDQSGNSRNAAQASTGAQPIYGSGANGKGAAIFGGAQQLQTASFSQAQPYFVWTVLMLDNLGAFQYMYGSAGSSPDFVGAYNDGIYAGSVLNPWPSGGLTSGTWWGTRAWFNGASSDISKTASPLTSGAAGTAPINGGWFLGNRFDGGTPMLGGIAEQIIFSSDPRTLPGWSAFATDSNAYFGL